ncbi:MAG: glycosyltransferase family A protein [Pseudomonadota bacterium]
MSDVTVVIPMRDVAPWIADAIASIPRPAGRTLEILCVDDGSTDDTLSVIEGLGEPRVRVLQSTGSGISTARNTGIEAASGETILFLDADDMYRGEGIAALLEALDDHPDCGVVFGLAGFVREDLSRIVVPRPQTLDGRMNDHILQGKFTHIALGAYRRAVFDEVGFFRPFFVTAQDMDLHLRLAERVEMTQVPIHVLDCRIRGSSISRTDSKARRDWYVEKALAFSAERRETGRDALMRGEVPSEPDFKGARRVDDAATMELRLLLARAWKELADGATATAWGLLGSTLSRRAYLARANPEKARLAFKLFRIELGRAFGASSRRC